MTLSPMGVKGLNRVAYELYPQDGVRVELDAVQRLLFVKLLCETVIFICTCPFRLVLNCVLSTVLINEYAMLCYAI